MTAEIDIVRNARARRVRLTVDPTSGRARLTLPKRAALKPALKWAEQQQAWLATQRARLPEGRPFAHHATLPYRGETVTIDWSADRPRRVALDGERLVVGGPAEGLSRRVETWLRRSALELLREETAFFAERAGVTVSAVSIGDPRGRWGSCSSAGAIRYSWRLILAPDSVRRATVAHEVAHRIHMHHGPDFHAFAAEVLGDDPTPARAWLKRHGAALHWVGRGA
ncbi:MAG: M48 family metallopeptidase [Sphingomonas sp.]